jgi:DNA-binding XRE family transcriptional regulator
VVFEENITEYNRCRKVMDPMGSGLKPDGLKVKSFRIQRGWPQEQLARIADVSPRTIQRLEAGGNASLETLRSLASAFELEVQDLLGETPKTGVSGSAPDVSETGQIASVDRNEHGMGETQSTPSQCGRSERATLDSVTLVLPEQAAAPSVQLEAFVPTAKAVMQIAGAFSAFHACAPFLRGVLGSVVMVLLAAAVIRLSPLLLQHEPVQKATDAAAISGQGSGLTSPANYAAQPEEIPAASGAAVKAPHLLPAKSALAKQAALGEATKRISGVPINDAALTDRSPGYADGQLPAETRIDGLQEAGTVNPAVETGFTELHPATTARLSELLELPSAAFGAPAGAEKDKPGLAGFVGQGAANGYNTVSKSLRQSSMNTATFFSRVGVSFKRVF